MIADNDDTHDYIPQKDKQKEDETPIPNANNELEIQPDFSILKKGKKPNCAAKLPKTAVSTSKADNAIANRYKLAHKKLFETLPAWRQEELMALKSKREFNNRFFSDFAKQVMELAESGVAL